MTVWRWIKAWVSNQTTLALLVVDLEARGERLVAELRRQDARHQAETAALRAENEGLRREAEALDAANQAVIGQNRRERQFGNQLAHRNRLGVEWAARNLPEGQTAELRAVLAPKLSGPQEVTHVR